MKRLPAQLFSLRGREHAVTRLAMGCRFVRLAEKLQDVELFLVARAFRIGPLLALRELPLVDVEIEATASLARQHGHSLFAHAAAVLGTLTRSGGETAPPGPSTCAALERLASEAQRIPSIDRLWPAIPGVLAEACAELGAGLVAAQVHDTLALCMQREPFAGMDEKDAETARAVGLLAAVAGRWVAAERHFGIALEHFARTSDPTLLPLTQHGIAATLLESKRQGSRQRALELLAQAIAGYRQTDLSAECDRAIARSASARGKSAPTAGSLTQEGEYWTLCYRSRVVRLKDTKGLRDVLRLLERPGQDIHVMELVRAADPPPPCHLEARRFERDELRVERTAPGRRLPDRPALLAYARRLEELHGELEASEADNDLGHAERARKEIDFLETEVCSATGLGRLARDPSAPAEKARKAVSKRIRSEINRIAAYHEELGRHLRAAVRTGTYCSYAPAEATEWRIARDPDPVDNALLPDE